MTRTIPPVPRRLRELAECTAGLSVVEFALVLPLLMTLGFYGIETASLAVANLQVSQIAMSTADNAARMEQGSSSAVTPTVTESDVASVLTGAIKEAGALNFAANGKVVLSSLEVNASGNPYIHWQRCTGGYSAASAYGVEGATVTGMGNTAGRITAPAGSAVMFVEVFYRKSGIFGSLFVRPMIFHQEAAYLIRDTRNLAVGLSGTRSGAC
ncbi:MAG: pilus assembly protein TadE [Sphingomonadales bacterium]|nr:pilus assembly protein TadE [Sphingomonadales bacterium]